MTSRDSKKSPNPKPASKRSKLPTPITVAIISLVGTILASLLGVFSFDLNENIPPTLQTESENEPVETLSIEEQIAILGATATKSAETTATQFAMEVQRTIEAEMVAQQIRTEISASETQKVIGPTQTAEQIQFITSTAAANVTATALVAQIWQEQHQFLDEFSNDLNGWSGNDKSTNVSIDSSNGTLIFETDKNSKISFWKCDVCFIPTDHSNYSFEVKYYAPKANTEFNFGLLFGCNQFDEELVSCQAIQLVNQNYIRVIKTGTSKEYQVNSYYIAPNDKGLVSVRWEVSNQKFKLWINNQNVMNNVDLDGTAGGYFGFYCDPPGSKVAIERVEIYPLP